MRNINYETITDTEVKACSGTSNNRFREMLSLLIPRLHDFVMARTA